MQAEIDAARDQLEEEDQTEPINVDGAEDEAKEKEVEM